MIYITQLIYIKDGQEMAFQEFENIAIPIISKYNGRLLLRLRTGPDTIIENHIETPYEVHLISFENEQSFEDFKLDEERQQFLHLKEQSIKASILIQGSQI